jgi:hypothetical protein
LKHVIIFVLWLCKSFSNLSASIPLLKKSYKVIQSSSSSDFALWGAICYTSKSLIAMMASVVVTNIASVTYWLQVLLVSQTLSYLCCLSNDIVNTLKTPQRLVLKRINQLTRSTSLFPLKKATRKSNLEGSAPLHTVREHWCSVPSSGREFQCCVPLLREPWFFLGKIWSVEGNQGRIPSIFEGG